MAETRTLKFELPQWSSGTTDSPSREDFNEAFANIENWGAGLSPLVAAAMDGAIDIALGELELWEEAHYA